MGQGSLSSHCFKAVSSRSSGRKSQCSSGSSDGDIKYEARSQGSDKGSKNLSIFKSNNRVANLSPSEISPISGNIDCLENNAIILGDNLDGFDQQVNVTFGMNSRETTFDQV